MASIFKRPGLVAMEVGWRVLAALPLLYAVVVIVLGGMGMDIHLGGKVGSIAMPVVRPEELAHFSKLFLQGSFFLGGTHALLARTLLYAIFWAAVCGFMRSISLQRLDSKLAAQRLTVVVLSILRVITFLAVLAAWFWMLYFIWFREVARLEPAYVPAFALAVVGTLVLFSLWSIVSWVFPLATTLAMFQRLSTLQSLRVALQSRAIRSKLIEINLVMGIVKVCLIVLAMVFSACPLPFEVVATQEFMVWWTAGVLVLWVIASDYFHVVRAAAVLALTKAYETA